MHGRATDTGSRIIESAIELFSKKGYTETSVNEIAQLSGIRAGSIYNYYSSKAEIMDYILQMYIDVSKENTLTREMIDAKVKTEEPRELLKAMFYRYPQKDAATCTKILRIILHEQYRNEAVGQFVREYFINGVERDVDYILRKLIEKGRIAPVNHLYYAKILNDLCIAATMQFSHYGSHSGYNGNDRILMDDVIGFIIEKILSDSGEYSAPSEEERRWLRNSG